MASILHLLAATNKAAANVSRSASVRKEEGGLDGSYQMEPAENLDNDRKDEEEYTVEFLSAKGDEKRTERIDDVVPAEPVPVVPIADPPVVSEPPIPPPTPPPTKPPYQNIAIPLSILAIIATIIGGIAIIRRNYKKN
ncbi:MAG: hypothetical protein Hyperionvirus9_7 [Hyperionvirus sp.]|uniref:Uncharacterized protein n=1 Tax=Hyperionvirus sp. TaxID=2487770 RepID=A0A3G5A8J2_9VIRU|nr:MAG: hypothetical protein Hyperionvirus9_7 [Hyperionvirus sp.]